MNIQTVTSITLKVHTINISFKATQEKTIDIIINGRTFVNFTPQRECQIDSIEMCMFYLTQYLHSVICVDNNPTYELFYNDYTIEHQTTKLYRDMQAIQRKWHSATAVDAQELSKALWEHYKF